MAPTARLSPSRIPVFRSSSTASATPVAEPVISAADYPAYDSDGDTDPTSDDERRKAALSIRSTCSTPTFNQSSKFSNLAACDAPTSPMMHRGQGICNLPRYTDYKDAIDDDGSPLPLSVSRSLGRKPSRFRLRRRRSKNSLGSSDGSSDGHSSRSPSPGTVSSIFDQKPLPLPPLFPPCTSPIDDDESYHDATPIAEVPPPLKPKFKIRRKPAPEYFPDVEVPSLDSDSSSATSSEDSAEQRSALQSVGPNVFIAYDDDSTFALMTAFTHIVRLSHGETSIPPSLTSVSFEPETGVHTLYLPIPSLWPTRLPDGIAELSPISESHRDIQFSSSLTPLNAKKSRRRAIAGPAPPAATTADTSLMMAKALADELYSPSRPFSQADLIATQNFLAASGRVVSLPELAYFLSDDPMLPASPPLGLQVRHVDMVLSFLRPRPFAPTARRRVLLMTSRGQLAREGLALMACYLARVEGWSIQFALRKFEGSVGTVSRCWRGLLGREGVIATYLEELLLAA
ncbi:hypothetical protein C8F04DRAFT_1094096 [Mycena alexandri]|uniref:Uncharacterized protein n=1 Tax=Mycena alexandri TaxID=1745969 RepID=A0AAD6T0S9_9AGAR|nr:hypothetical protein C8F04DRAFT_1094096 [Mycena alexandri]